MAFRPEEQAANPNASPIEKASAVPKADAEPLHELVRKGFGISTLTVRLRLVLMRLPESPPSGRLQPDQPEDGRLMSGALIRCNVSKSADRQTRKSDQQRGSDRNDTFGTDAKIPEADLQSMTHGAALRLKNMKSESVFSEGFVRVGIFQIVSNN
jgi:hypothetical protein